MTHGPWWRCFTAVPRLRERSHGGRAKLPQRRRGPALGSDRWRLLHDDLRGRVRHQGRHRTLAAAWTRAAAALHTSYTSPTSRGPGVPRAGTRIDTRAAGNARARATTGAAPSAGSIAASASAAARGAEHGGGRGAAAALVDAVAAVVAFRAALRDLATQAPRFSQRPTSFGSAMPASDAGAGFVQ